MANPEPEVDPIAAAQHAAVVATGRSDFANQINNVLVFPGVFRGLLDAASTSIDEDVMLAAAKALSEVVHPDELNAAYIIPSVFHPDVSKVVAAAVKAAVLGTTPEQVPPGGWPKSPSSLASSSPDDQGPAGSTARRAQLGPGSSRPWSSAHGADRAAWSSPSCWSPTWPRSTGPGSTSRARSRGATRSCTSCSSSRPRWRGLLAGLRPAYLVGLLALHAPVSELVQHYLLPNRSGDPWDAVADLVRGGARGHVRRGREGAAALIDWSGSDRRRWQRQQVAQAPQTHSLLRLQTHRMTTVDPVQRAPAGLRLVFFVALARWLETCLPRVPEVS